MKNKFAELFNKCISEKGIDLFWLLAIPIININYFLASITAKNTINLSTAVDDKIAFNSFFIIPYVYWYAYVVIGFILILKSDRSKYMRCLLATLVGMLTSYVFFYVFPTEISRPIVNDSNILNKLVNLIYYNDRPVNCFPSLHVLNTYLIMRYTKIDYSKKKYYYTQIVGILIILSTVYIKQHFVYDIIGAIIIAEMVISLINRIPNDKINLLLELPYNTLGKLNNVNLKQNKEGIKSINLKEKQELV